MPLLWYSSPYFEDVNMSLTGAETLERNWLLDLIANPERLDYLDLTYDDVLKRLNFLTYKELYNDCDDEQDCNHRFN